MLIADIDYTIQLLNKFKDQGFQISIDDFGTGYSSLSYIKRFPIDIIKIDRSFVRDLKEGCPEPILSSVISIARGIGADIIAEGVETTEQLFYLRNMGCDIIQGYFFSPPVAEEKFHAVTQEAGNKTYGF